MMSFLVLVTSFSSFSDELFSFSDELFEFE